ncbi:hypothetical protein CB1_000719007, partial [Camelus ferus]
VYDEIEVFPLNVYDVQLTKTGGVSDFGFAVTAQVDERQHLNRIFISDVLPDGLAYGEGLRKGNEIMTLNGEAVSDLDLKQMEALFSEKSVGLTLIARPPDTRGTLCSSWSDSDLFSRDQKGLLPPPNQSQLLEEFLDNFKKNTANGSAQEDPELLGVSCPKPRGSLVVCGELSDLSNVPDITTGLKRSQTDGTLDQVSHRQKKEQTFRSAEEIAVLCGFNDTQTNGMDGPRESQDPPPRPLARHLSDADRLRKVIQELVDTEKSYVKDLSCLFDLYLEPLQSETFLTQDEKLLFSLGGSFLYYADHFKLYSGFCANHIKVQKVLERAKTDKAFKAFLDARNPTKQHSSTLESYLIKPVQRVLKYPLLLRELVSLTDHDSEEHYHLTGFQTNKNDKTNVIAYFAEALKAMEKVASHINEMQKIYEDYGTVFDQLVAEQSGTEKEVVFKRAVILVYKENCKLKKKLATGGPGDVEGRQDETVGTTNVLSLPTSDNESKTNIVKVIRSILRENFRRHIKCEFPLEKTCKDRLVPLKNRVPVSAKLGECSAGPGFIQESVPEPGKGPQASLAAFPDGLIKESDILSDDDEDHHQPRGRGSPTKDIEIQFQRLRISEDPDAPLADGPPSRDGQPGGPQSKLVRGHFCAIKRKANSTKRDRGTLLKAQTRHQSLDSRSENANLDLNAVLEREFSVQSLTSVVNEECFYETESHGKS